MTKDYKSQRQKTLDLTYMGMALALLIVSAKITIPIHPVPIAMLTFSVMLIAMLLGAKRAVLVQTVYLIIGLVGLPVFTQGGGPDYVFRPSFGYIVGFILAAYVTGTLFDFCRVAFKKGDTALGVWWSAMLSGLAGLLAIYTVGVGYLIVLSRLYFGSSEGILHFMRVGAWLFVPSDVLSIFLATVAASTLFKLVPQLRREVRIQKSQSPLL